MQSERIEDRSALDRQMAEAEKRWPEGVEIPLPAFWGGVLVRPTSVEFWQGRPSRLHDRLRYETARPGSALDEAGELVTEAFAAKDEVRRALYAERYDDLRHAITEASGATVKEAGCLTAHARARLEVILDANGRMRHIVRGCDLSSGNEGLDLPPPLEAFAVDAEIEAARDAIAAAFSRLDRAAQIFLDDAGALTAAAQL